MKRFMFGVALTFLLSGCVSHQYYSNGKLVKKATVTSASRVSPPKSNKWERPEKRQKGKDDDRPVVTVDNYMEPGALPSDCGCQTANYAVASKRIAKKAQELKDLQTRCLAGEDNPDCDENPGVISADYFQLSRDLDALQKSRERRTK